jgi:fumarylacetoacetase
MTTAAQQFATEGFGPENLPYASFTGPSSDTARLGARLGDRVLDLAALADAGVGTGHPLSPAASAAVHAANLDTLLAAGRSVWDEVRAWLQAAVAAEGDVDAVVRASVPLGEVTLQLPFTVADYVDGYASEHHATNVGHIFRPDQPPLLPNWKNLPVGYHGRAGTIVVSGTPVPRPKGLRPEPDGVPSFGPSRRLDFEAELAFVLGGSAPQGEVSVARAADHLFGAVVLNDWSARDIQAYEYVPLGPYLGKSFASSISPWVVPFAALDAAGLPAPARALPLVDYLDDSAEPWGLDITVETSIDEHVISRSPAKTLYWTAPQFVAHMTVNGAGLRPGDLIGTGTISGPEKEQRGSLLELSWGGTAPIALGGGRTMTFLEDGQTVTMAATAPGPGGATISFGEVTGRIEPSR